MQRSGRRRRRSIELRQAWRHARETCGSGWIIRSRRWRWRRRRRRRRINIIETPSVRLDLGQGDLVKGAKRRGSRSDADEKKRNHQSHFCKNGSRSDQRFHPFIPPRARKKRSKRPLIRDVKFVDLFVDLLGSFFMLFFLILKSCLLAST